MERFAGEIEGQVDWESKVDLFKQDEFRYGIEKFSDFYNRINDFMDYITTNYNNKNILIVTHAGVGVAINVYFNGVPSDGNYKKYLTRNCEILAFENKSHT